MPLRCNRTSVELKPDIGPAWSACTAGCNRTSVELKHALIAVTADQNKSCNRTSVELKQTKKAAQRLIKPAVIEPVWN